MKDSAKKNAELAELRQRKIIDLQKQLDLQKEIGELNSRLAAIVESSDDAIIGKDLKSIITSWNKGAEKIYGYEAREAIGRPVSILVPSGRTEEIQSILEKIRKGERLEHFETVRMTKAGQKIDISLTVSPVRDAAGAIIGASTISRDITGHKKYEEMIKRQAIILDQIQDAVITTDLHGIVTSWNRGAEKIYFYSAEEAVGRHISFIYPEDQLEFLEHGVIGPLKEKGVLEREVRLRRKSGEEFHALLLLSLLRDGSGSPTGMIGSSIDISAHNKADELIRLGKEEWEQTFDAIPDMVAVIDKQYVIRRANKAVAGKLGIDWKELIGKYCYEAICGSEKQLPKCSGSMAVSTGSERIEERYVEKLKGHYLISFTPIFALDGCLSGFVEVWRDISQQKEAEKKLYEAANTDILTGLYNRRGFIALAEHQLRVADRERKNLILVYLDLDDMKRINDQFGHKEGDRALADIANILRKSFRESDVLGRLGGDEFAILLTEPSEQDIEQVISEHIQQNLRSHNEQNGRPYLLSVSIGVSRYNPANPCTLDDLLTSADKIMYREKGYIEPEEYN
jgi:diguanylate cyclase (GGDEF)-like protein/PAS domain S-box-containing protein